MRKIFSTITTGRTHGKRDTFREGSGLTLANFLSAGLLYFLVVACSEEAARNMAEMVVENMDETMVEAKSLRGEWVGKCRKEGDLTWFLPFRDHYRFGDDQQVVFHKYFFSHPEIEIDLTDRNSCTDPLFVVKYGGRYEFASRGEGGSGGMLTIHWRDSTLTPLSGQGVALLRSKRICGKNDWSLREEFSLAGLWGGMNLAGCEYWPIEDYEDEAVRILDNKLYLGDAPPLQKEGENLVEIRRKGHL